MARDNWTEEQITVVLYEYCQNPFGQFSGTKQFVKNLAQILGRTSRAITVHTKARATKYSKSSY